MLPGFFAGKYAMTVPGSTSAAQQIVGAPDGLDWVALPPLAGRGATQAANPQTLSVSADASTPSRPRQFINFFMQADNLAAVAQGDWLIPTRPRPGSVVAADRRARRLGRRSSPAART